MDGAGHRADHGAALVELTVVTRVAAASAAVMSSTTRFTAVAAGLSISRASIR